MKRREFVKMLTGGTMMFYAVALSEKPVEAKALGQEKRKTVNPDFISDDTREILRLASLAPSGHNTQPWLIQMIDSEHFTLSIDESRYLPEVDPDHRETLISMGCFLENLTLAAGNMGYRAEIDITAQESDDKEIAAVRLSQDEQFTYPVERMENRRTLRSGYAAEPIRTGDLDFLMDDDPDQWTYFSPDASQSAYIEKVTLEAFTQQTYRDSAQAELADWIRFSKREIKKQKDGLTPATMEMPWIARVITGMLYDEKNVMSESFRKTGIKSVEDQLAQYGGWLVLSAKDASPESLLEAGRRFQRLALKAREKNIAVHPMSQALEEKPWKDQVAEKLGIQGEVQFLLRVGYVNSYPEPVSPRRPVDWFVQA